MLVELLEVFGTDLTVVNAARVSFGKESTEMVDRDKKLIKYLATHNHNSPFFHPIARFRMKMPIFVAREWFRHTVGFARNEVSRRYVDDPPECYIPSEDNIRERDSNKKQGSREGSVKDAKLARSLIVEETNKALYAYKALLDLNVAPEVARIILPQSMYTEFIETASIAAYARLCSLRLDPQAQKEIREYAAEVSVLLEEKFPVSWAALQPHASASESGSSA